MSLTPHRRLAHRTLAVVAAVCAAAAVLVLPHPLLESADFTFEYVEYREDGTALYKPHADSEMSVVHSMGNQDGPIPLTPAMADSIQARWEIAYGLFQAGVLELVRVVGETFGGISTYCLFYEGESDGEVYEYTDTLGDNEDPAFLEWITGGEYLDAHESRIAGRLQSLPPDTVEIDGLVVTFARWRQNHPVHGEIVFLVSDGIN